MRKILAVVTNAAALGKYFKKTGLWFRELTGFYDAMKNRYTMDIISAGPNRVPIDPGAWRQCCHRKKLALII